MYWWRKKLNIVFSQQKKPTTKHYTDLCVLSFLIIELKYKSHYKKKNKGIWNIINITKPLIVIIWAPKTFCWWNYDLFLGVWASVVALFTPRNDWVLSSTHQIKQASSSQELCLGKQEVTHHPSAVTLKKLPLLSLRPLGGSPGSVLLEAMLTSCGEDQPAGAHWCACVSVRVSVYARVYIWVSVSRKGAPSLCGLKTHFSCGFNERKFLGCPQPVLWKICPAGIDSGCLFLLSVCLLALYTLPLLVRSPLPASIVLSQSI